MLDQLNRSLNPEETFLEVVKKYILIPDSILELDRLVCVSTYCFPLSISCSALPVFYFMFNFYVFYYYFNFDTIFVFGMCGIKYRKLKHDPNNFLFLCILPMFHSHVFILCVSFFLRQKSFKRSSWLNI